jgi:hypothetical protein
MANKNKPVKEVGEHGFYASMITEKNISWLSCTPFYP